MSAPISIDDEIVYLYIVSKRIAMSYTTIELPGHYTGTVREESKLSYATLSVILHSKFGVTFNPQDILVTKEGKPYQKNNAYHFSYAHCTDYIACAVGSEKIGVDIEQPREVPDKIYSKILTNTEITNRVNPLYSWVIKEAYTKLGNPESRIIFSSRAAEELLQRAPSVIVQTIECLCALFHTKKSTKVIIEYQLS